MPADGKRAGGEVVGHPRVRRGANGAESTSFVILKALDYAAEHGAQIINMSFAGPKDPMIERGIAATASRVS